MLLNGARVNLPTLHLKGSFALGRREGVAGHVGARRQHAPAHPPRDRRNGCASDHSHRSSRRKTRRSRTSSPRSAVPSCPGIYFAFNSAELDPASDPALSAMSTAPREARRLDARDRGSHRQHRRRRLQPDAVRRSARMRCAVRSSAAITSRRLDCAPQASAQSVRVSRTPRSKAARAIGAWSSYVPVRNERSNRRPPETDSCLHALRTTAIAFTCALSLGDRRL